MNTERYETRHDVGEALAPHRHEHAYAALVLSGRYEEAGPDGVWICEAGEVVVHPPFHVHLNRFRNSGARVLNFELTHETARDLGVNAYAIVRVRDPGRVARAAHGRDALHEAMEGGETRASVGCGDWLDVLAEELRRDPRQPVGDLARDAGVTGAHASRAFRRRFGLSPAAFRSEHQVRRALAQLAGERQTLAGIAAREGFADQAHFTRRLRAATGRTPSALRALLR